MSAGRDQPDAVSTAGRSSSLSSAAKVFADSRESKPSAKEQRMETELRRAKDVIAEITAENLD